MVTMRNPGRVGITVLAGDEAPISKVQGNGRDANEEEDDDSGRLNSGEEAERGGPGTGGTAEMDDESERRNRDTPSPRFCVSAEYKGFKVICFDTHLQVFILKVVSVGSKNGRFRTRRELESAEGRERGVERITRNVSAWRLSSQ